MGVVIWLRCGIWLVASRGWRHQSNSQRGLLGWTTRSGSFPRPPLNFLGVGGVVDVVVVGTTSEQEREVGGGGGCVSRWSPGAAVLGFRVGEDRERERKKKKKKKKKGKRENQKERKDVREGAYKPQLYLLLYVCRSWQVKKKKKAYK